MKKIVFIILTFGVLACNNEFLDLKPTTQLGESDEFFNTESGLETFSNNFYNYIDYRKITDDFNSDNCEHIVNIPEIRKGIYTMPSTLGSGNWDWNELRNINYFIEKCSKSEIDYEIKNKYLGIAKFFRAMFYFDKVKLFGDVPWYSKPVQTNEEYLLYKARDSRILVIDSVLNDIDFAIKNLPENKHKNRASKYSALALKSRICLYEGTWRKYHNGMIGANELLTECVNASKQLMDSNIYSLYSTGNKKKDYFNLFQPQNAYTTEVIMARSFADGIFFYYTPLFTSTSNGNYGATRSLISSYLMSDGQSFQSKYPDENQREMMSYYNEFQNRDPRLSNSVIYPGYVRVGTMDKAVNDFAENRTGYQIIKAVGPPSEDQGGGSRDAIIFRYAEVLLNYVEAKAELGTLTQDDVNITLNVIRDRVGIPSLNLPVPINSELAAEYTNTNDPTIIEIRRERRVELAFEGFRKDDLIRWSEGQRFRVEYEGIYISGLKELIDLDNDGNADLYIYPENESAPIDKVPGVQYVKLNSPNGLSNGNSGRIVPNLGYNYKNFEDWEYLRPIPTEELTLNPNLDQNPGWDIN